MLLNILSMLLSHIHTCCPPRKCGLLPALMGHMVDLA